MPRPNPRALPAIVCALLCAALLAACGGSGKSASKQPSGPQATLQKTFGSGATSIDRARVVASLRLDPEGLLKLGGPIAVGVSGPFAAPTRSSPARFDLGLRVTLGGRHFRGAALSTGAKSYLRLDDRNYLIGDAGAAHGGPHPGLQALGIDPLRWITGVRDRGQEQIGGVKTRRLSGRADPKGLLADVGRLLDGAGGAPGSILSPELLAQIAGAVTSAQVDVWTGAADSVLRQLAVDVRFAFKSAQSPIVGLDGGRLRLRVRLSDVNGAPVKVAAPAAPRPLAQVTGPGGLGALLAGLGKGISGGIGGGAIDLVGCVTGAGGSSVDLVHCVSKLAP